MRHRLIGNCYSEIPPKEKSYPIAKNEIENLDDFIKRVQENENTFCKAMPLKIPIEYFRVFVKCKNKAGKFYLTESGFMAFINHAFMNGKSFEKITLNIGSREKLFVIKRFYEFYQKAIEYENTTQCKDKYIKLVSDNFTNWSYKNLKNNFGNKVKRQW